MSSKRRSDEPFWWYRDTTSLRARTITAALSPASAVYSWLAERRLARTPDYTSKLPVICVGNFTAGDTGKTPLVRAIIAQARKMGANPVVLSRGYGGATQGPHLIDLTRDTAAAVGDEPYLLAHDAPVVISIDRAAGARFIEAQSRLAASLIVMDDGLQNRTLAKTLTISVVDRRRGIGNGRTLPGGPLRAPLAAQLAMTDIIAEVTPPDDNGNQPARAAMNSTKKPVLALSVAPSGDVAWLKNTDVIAYAGIGAPERFFSLLEQLGARIVSRSIYPDHYTFTDTDAERLMAEQTNSGAQLVTTEKDLARLKGSAPLLTDLATRSRALPIQAVLDAPSEALLDQHMRRLLARTEV